LSAKAKQIDRGELAIKFVSKLKLVGDFAGQPFDPRPWQQDILRKLFGKLRTNGRRQYKRMFLALPRKQAKTTLTAAIAGYLLVGECQGKEQQQIYSASGDRAQASLIFKTLASMIRSDPILSERCLIYDSYKRIEYGPLGNTFEALSREAGYKHGLSPSAVLFDEVHVLPDRELHDVLTTGYGARLEPLTIYITTAGWDRQSICWELWEYARRVRDGLVEDPDFLPILYEAAPDADWRAESTWRACMPALDDFCSLDYIREECNRAQKLPAYENTFRQLFLNQWTEQANRWISLETWDNCKADFTPEDFAGRECVAGLDLSSTKDLTALVLMFPNELGGYDILPWFWLPGETAIEREKADRTPYTVWTRDGFLEQTGGKRIDYEYIKAKLLDLAKEYQFRSIGFDPQFAQMLASQLYQDGDGLPMVEVRNTFTVLNAPTREFERLVVEGKIRHNGHPVMRMCVANASLKERTGLVLPSKSNSSGRIDGVAAAVMGVAVGMGGPQSDSCYEHQDLLIL